MATQEGSGNASVVAEELRRLVGEGIASSRLDLPQLRRLEAAARRWDRVQDTDPAVAAGLAAVSLASASLESDSQAGTEDILVDRLVISLDEALGARTRAQSPEPSPSLEIAKQHLADAHRDRNRARVFAGCASLGAIAAGASGWWGVFIASEIPAKYPPAALAFPGLLTLGAIVGVLIMVRSARQAVLASREQTRIARAIAGLDTYLNPLPEPAQHFMRGKLAPIIFARLLEDNDPIRAIAWPSDTDLIMTISGYVEDGAETDSS